MDEHGLGLHYYQLPYTCVQVGCRTQGYSGAYVTQSWEHAGHLGNLCVCVSSAFPSWQLIHCTCCVAPLFLCAYICFMLQNIELDGSIPCFPESCAKALNPKLHSFELWGPLDKCRTIYHLLSHLLEDFLSLLRNLSPIIIFLWLPRCHTFDLTLWMALIFAGAHTGKYQGLLMWSF